MTITPKQAKLGVFIVILACIMFLGYWYYLLQPLQAKLIEAGKKPNFILAILRGTVVGAAFAFLTFLGLTLGGYAWQKWSDQTNLKLGDALESKSFWLWVACCVGGTLLFTLLWRYGNF